MTRASRRPRLSRLAVGLVAAALAASALVPAVAAIPAQAAAMGEARVWNFPAYSAGGQAYATLQGSATDGTYVYYARVDKTSGPDNSGQSTALIKASLATGQVVASVDYPVGTLCDGTPLDGVASCLGHGNDMTYNQNNGLLYVTGVQDANDTAARQPDYANGIVRVFNPNTMQLVTSVGTKSGGGFAGGATGLAYEPTRHVYVARISNRFAFYDDNYQPVAVNGVTGFTYSPWQSASSGFAWQGMDADANYIYVVSSAVTAAGGGYKAYVDVLNWSGVRVAQYACKGEGQSFMHTPQGLYYLGTRANQTFSGGDVLVNLTKFQVNLQYAGQGATSGTMAPQTVLYTPSIWLANNQFKRKGYTFQGWKAKNLTTNQSLYRCTVTKTKTKRGKTVYSAKKAAFKFYPTGQLPKRVVTDKRSSTVKVKVKTVCKRYVLKNTANVAKRITAGTLKLYAVWKKK